MASSIKTFNLVAYMLNNDSVDVNSRHKKRIIMLLGDLLQVPLALWVAFSLRLGEFYIPNQEIPYLFILAPIIAIPVFVRFGLYNAIIRYMGLHALWAVMQAVALYSLIWGVFSLISSIEGLLPRSVVVLNFFITLLFIGGSRMVARWWLAGVNPVQRLLKLHDAKK
ncbi:UDP-N-acetylglucosamine 4,6-dehydratase, partial [hydrothermal vent metagenome]